MVLKSAINKKVYGSSILEVVIAMLLVTIMMSISMGIFTNIMKASFNTRKIDAFTKIRSLSVLAKQEKRFSTEEFTEADYKIKKQVDNYADIMGAVQIKWLAEDEEGKVIAEYREIVAAE